MTWMEWLRGHTIGWPYFVAGLVILGFGGALALARRRPARLPWLFLAAWLVAAGANYVAIGVHQLFAFDRSMWAAQLVVIAAVSLVPPLFGLAMLILLRRRALAGGWKAVGAATVLVGACGILLAPSVSVFLAPFLMPAGGP
jgi:hypothetical protein